MIDWKDYKAFNQRYFVGSDGIGIEFIEDLYQAFRTRILSEVRAYVVEKDTSLPLFYVDNHKTSDFDHPNNNTPQDKEMNDYTVEEYQPFESHIANPKTRFLKIGELRQPETDQELRVRRASLIEELSKLNKRNADIRHDLRCGKQSFEYYLLMAQRSLHKGKNVTAALLRKLQEGTDNSNRIRNINLELGDIKKQLPATERPFSEHFIDACKNLMEPDDYQYLKDEAKRLQLEAQ